MTLMVLIAKINGNVYFKIKENLFFGFVIMITGLFFSMLKEKIIKEKWALLDSFRRSERILEKVIENSSSCIFLIDGNKNILLENKLASAFKKEIGKV